MSLDEKRKKYDIPPLTAGSLWKNVQIYRLEGETKTAGGLIIPDEHKEVRSRGILLDAGLVAMDSLADELVEIGDEVTFAHYAGRDREVGRDAGGSARKILECKVEDIIASVEQLERRKTHKRVRDEETGEHLWRKK